MKCNNKISKNCKQKRTQKIMLLIVSFKMILSSKLLPKFLTCFQFLNFEMKLWVFNIFLFQSSSLHVAVDSICFCRIRLWLTSRFYWFASLSNVFYMERYWLRNQYVLICWKIWFFFNFSQNHYENKYLPLFYIAFSFWLFYVWST
jgi:hypothetical protein